MSRDTRTVRAFTIIELITVVAIISILAAILLPALGRAKHKAQEVLCKSRQRQIMTAFYLFANEHDHFMPGNRSDRDMTGDDAWMSCWLFGTSNFNDSPYEGTIYPYLNDDRVYRCPSLEFVGVDAAEGSNGKFDFSAWEGLTGAKVVNLPTEAYYTAGGSETVPAPLITEENPEKYLNKTYKDGGHGNRDQMGHRHRGGGNYAAIDGSTQWFVESLSRDANSWSAYGPQGTLAQIGKRDAEFGWWNEQ